MIVINKKLLLFALLVFLSYLVIGLFLDAYNLRPDLNLRVNYGSECIFKFNLIQNANIELAQLYNQIKHISDFATCLIFSSVFTSKTYTLFLLPPLLGLLLYFVMVSYFLKNMPTRPVPYITIYLILMFPSIIFSVGEHFKSTVGLIFLFISLSTKNKFKNLIFLSLSVLAHVTSLISFIIFRILDLESIWKKLICVFIFALFCYLINIIYLSVNTDDWGNPINSISYDFQTILVLTLGSILGFNIKNESNYLFNIFPLVLLIILGSTIIGGRAITVAAPLLLAQGLIRNPNLWIMLVPMSLLNLIFITNLFSLLK